MRKEAAVNWIRISSLLPLCGPHPVHTGIIEVVLASLAWLRGSALIILFLLDLLILR